MNGGTQRELLRQNSGYPRRTNIAEKNYKAKHTTYQTKKNQIKNIGIKDYYFIILIN